jgi:hypothetical protein
MFSYIALVAIKLYTYSVYVIKIKIALSLSANHVGVDPHVIERLRD